MKSASRPNREAALPSEVLAKIAAMPEPFRAMGERVHALILRNAPALQPRLWYGMPGYAKDGTTVCFFRADKKYMTFGFTQEANLTPEAKEGFLRSEVDGKQLYYSINRDYRQLREVMELLEEMIAWDTT